MGVAGGEEGGHGEPGEALRAAERASESVECGEGVCEFVVFLMVYISGSH